MFSTYFTGFVLACLIALSPFNMAMAKQRQVTTSDDLQQLLDSSEQGDTLILDGGRYLGNFIIRHGITLQGLQGAIIDANGQGHALLLKSSNVVIKNLTIVNWGQDLTAQDAGIYTDQKSSHISIENNRLQGDGFGIWLQKGEHLKVLNNIIRGNSSLRSVDRGNGIQLSIVKNVEVRGNDIAHTRDGIYIISSEHNVLADNKVHDLRYGVHYMYSHSNKVINNSAYNTRAGYALMSSRNLVVEGNSSKDSQDYGFLLNFITSSQINHNKIEQVWTKPQNKVLGRDGKGLFVYNSAYNTISNNVIDGCEIGIHLTAGSENTKIFSNSFINNPTQVKYVSTKKQEWSLNQRGNFWSNYLGWDMDNDGIGELVFEPNDGIDKLIWQYPEMKVLMDSPAVIILRWVQRQFPVLRSPGITDSFPLMQSPQTSGHNLLRKRNDHE